MIDDTALADALIRALGRHGVKPAPAPEPTTTSTPAEPAPAAPDAPDGSAWLRAVIAGTTPPAAPPTQGDAA